MYKIIGGDQREYGPITADQVRQWIAQNRANAQTRAKAETGGDWQPLSAFPEFAAALGAKTGGPPPIPGVPTDEPKTSGLAIASLVCGILGLCGVTALAGLILGIVAQSKISKSQGQLRGRGLATAGIVLSSVFLLLSLLLIPASLLLPALSKAQAKAQSIKCVTNLKQVGLAARIWASDHGEKLPTSFQQFTNELERPSVLVCPKAAQVSSTENFAGFDFSRVTYELLAPGAPDDIPVADFARCPIHGHVVRTDGSAIMGTGR